MGIHLYLLPLSICDGLRCLQAVGGGVFPHGIGTVGQEPAIWHPASQSEAEVHTEMIV